MEERQQRDRVRPARHGHQIGADRERTAVADAPFEQDESTVPVARRRLDDGLMIVDSTAIVIEPPAEYAAS